jgi:hypothetical protein
MILLPPPATPVASRWPFTMIFRPTAGPELSTTIGAAKVTFDWNGRSQSPEHAALRHSGHDLALDAVKPTLCRMNDE